MVLRPVVTETPRPGAGYAPVWPAIDRAQRQVAREYWLVSQTDHAALAGALAASFISPDFPAPDERIARAIEVHDAGWAIFEPEANPGAAPHLDRRGKPLSFLEIDPPDFLRAWTGSIARAESVACDGAYLVSRHFCALAEGRLASAIDSGENSTCLRQFLAGEAERQGRLLAAAGRSAAELEDLLLVLQFCDVLSLYLCSGITDPVEFPHQFKAGRVRVRCEDRTYLLQPSPFRSRPEAGDVLSLGVEARRYPSDRPHITTLPFLLW